MKSGMRAIGCSLASLALIGLLALGVLVGSGMSDHVGVADVALVLGNKVHPDGSPSSRLKARLDATAQFYRKGCFKKIIVSGATGKEGVPEGTAMKRYLVQAGVPEIVIVVDDEGVDTWASAAHTADIVRAEKASSVFVITQYFHVPRTKLALAKCGVSPLFHAHPRYFEARDLYSSAREIPAYISYFFRPSRSDRQQASSKE